MNEAGQSCFLAGVIEGFYGRQWSQATRLAYADYLISLGLNTYIYAPKGDPYLRRIWSQAWPEEQVRDLRALSDHYRSRKLQFGVGLSPFELYKHYGTPEQAQLRQKVNEIADLGVSQLSILFDDMPGDLASLADRQAEIVTDVFSWVPHLRIQVCPTYYSYDPVLQKYFGAMPDAYWPDLGAALPAGVDVYWTGNAVCSDAVSVSDVCSIAEQLGRRVMLWDNYPVNDGALRSKRLYCQPLEGRGQSLQEHLSGHLCNPMNQGVLSLPALIGLANLHGSNPGPTFLSEVMGARTWALLQLHQDAFCDLGLDGMDEERRAELATQFNALPGDAAAEVAGWLRGEYTFDPACLTD